MKTILFAHLIISVILLGCDWIKTDNVKPFIPGVYARHYKDEYTNSYDTISIRLINPPGTNDYTIIKRSHFEKLSDNGKMIPGYELKHWTGTYDDKTKTIWLQAAGKRIYFDPDKEELKIGTEPYKKL
jgi:hypothetical protein